MGKIVKYCGSCDEGFAEKFGFCPDCGAQLQAFEMSPVEGQGSEGFAAAPADNIEPQAPEFIAEAVENEPVVEVEAAGAGFEDPEISEPEEIIEEAPQTAAAIPATEAFYRHEAVYADEPRHYTQPSANMEDYNDYHVTVIQENAGKERNLLLLGASFLALSIMVGLTIASLFSIDLAVGAIGEERSLAMLIEDVPMPVEEEEQQKKEDDAGGGGGGGRDEETPTSQGNLADQTKNPIIRPDVRIEKHDFELVQPIAATEGTKKFEKPFDRYGNPNSTLAGLSNGMGTGGGQGEGHGNGQGTGTGTGAGSGTGSGYGSGDGDGDGNGSGSGTRGSGAPPPAVPRVTTAAKILSKPKPGYTDPARTNNVQGSVSLKVVLLASGQIGSITPITRLPHGLTEQAIAAARRITFVPRKVNGVPTSASVTVVYSFNIY